MAKYTVLTTSDKKQLHVVKTTEASPGDGDWASQDSANSPRHLSASIISYWARLARPETADAEATPTGQNLSFGNATQPKLAQSFTGLTGALAAFRLRIRNNGSPTDGVIFSLQGDNAGEPDGTIIESRTIDNSDLTASYQDIFFSLKAPLLVSSGDVHWIVAERSGSLDAVNNYELEFNATNPYSSGTGAFYNGTVWADFTSNNDLNFSVWLGDIHIATQVGSGQVLYHVFDPGTDTYTTVDEIVGQVGLPATMSASPPREEAVTLGIRADGDVVVAWNGEFTDEPNRDAIFWARREGGTWTRELLTSFGSSEHSDCGAFIGPDAADRLYLARKLQSASFGLETIQADNTVTSSVIDTTFDTADLVQGPGVIDENDKSYVGYIDASNQISVASWAAADTPSPSVDTDVSDNTVLGHSSALDPFAVFCLAVLGADIHLLYSDDTDQDLQHDDEVATGGTTDVELLAATVNLLSCKVNSGQLQYVYDDAGTTKYGFLSLVITSPNIVVPVGSLVLTGVAPSLDFGFVIPAGDLDLRTKVIEHSIGFIIEPPVGAIVLTGFAPSRVVNHAKVPGVGALTFATAAPLVSRNFNPPAAALTLTGFAPSLDFGFAQTTGSLTLTGFTPTRFVDRLTEVPAGALTLTSFASELDRGIFPGVGSLTFTGFAPTILQTILKIPPVASLTLTGFAPSLDFGFTIPAGTLTLSGQVPVRFVDRITEVPKADLTLTGFAPTVEADKPIEVPAGALALAGVSPSLDMNVGVPVGALTLTGFAPGIVAGINRVMPVGSLTLTGFAPTRFVSRITEIGVGALALTGFVPAVGIVLFPAPAALTLTGFAPAIFVSVAIEVPTGALSLTGVSPSLGFGYFPPVGALTLTGFAPTRFVSRLTEIPVGALVLTGFAPSLDFGQSPGTGSLTLTGFAPTRLVDKLTEIPPGALTLTGFAPTVQTTVLILPLVGTLTLTGFAPSIGLSIEVPSGTLTLTGFAPDIGGLVEIDVPVGALTLTGFAPTAVDLVGNPKLVPATASLTLTGVQAVCTQGPVRVVPAAGLTLTGFAPFLQEIREPATATLTLTGFVPVVTTELAVEIIPPAGALTFSSAAAICKVEYAPNIPAGTLTLTGYAPVVRPTIVPSTGALTLTGFAPAREIGIHPAQGSLVLSGTAPTIHLSVSTPAGSLSLVGFAPAVEVALHPATATLTLTGFAPTIHLGVEILTGSLTLTTEAAICTVTVAGDAVVIPVPTGTLQLTGFAPTLHLVVTVPTATLVLSTFAPDLEDTKKRISGAASLTLTGFIPTCVVDILLEVPAGALTLSSQAPVLGYAPTPAAASLVLSTFAPEVQRAHIVPTAQLRLIGQIPTVSLAFIQGWTEEDPASGTWSEESSASGDWTEETLLTGTWTEENAA